jgi:hypothetical protein
LVLPTFAVEVNCGLRGARVCPAGPTPHHGPRSLTPTAVAGRVEAPRLWGASKLRLRLVRARRVHQRALSAHGNELQAESYPGSPDLRQIEHGGRPPGIFSAKAAPGMISVPTTIRVAAIAFFNSSSPVFASLGGRYSSGSTVLCGHRWLQPTPPGTALPTPLASVLLRYFQEVRAF